MSDFPGDNQGGSAAETEDLREQLIILANRGKIKNTERILRKAPVKQLERIKAEYDRQQTEVVDELVSKYLIGGVSKLLRSMEYIDDAECEEMTSTLMSNDLVKRDLSDISGYITRNIRYIGIATMVAVAGGYVLSKRYGQQAEPTETTGFSGNIKVPGWQSFEPSQNDPPEGRQDGE